MCEWVVKKELRNLERFCLQLDNQGSEQQMETTIGFNRVERCRNNLPWGFDCRVLMVFGEGEEVLAEF